MSKKIRLFSIYPHYIHSTLIFLVALLCVNLLSCTSTQDVSIDINEEFQNSIGNEVTLNQELSLKSDLLRWETLEQETLTLVVTNLSEEKIVFSNHIAGLTIFRLDDQSFEWEEVNFHFLSFSDAKILDPLSWQSEVDQLVIQVNQRNLDILEGDEWLRFFVLGRNMTSSNYFGAFVDIEIE